MDDTMVETLRRHWDDGWNRGDLDTIMAPFAPDIVFSSPFVPKLLNDPEQTELVGRQALGDYCRYALDRTPGIRYTVDATYAGTDTLVLVYTCFLPNDTIKKGADSMRIDASGQVVEWRCHYSFDSMELTT